MKTFEDKVLKIRDALARCIIIKDLNKVRVEGLNVAYKGGTDEEIQTAMIKAVLGENNAR